MTSDPAPVKRYAIVVDMRAGTYTIFDRQVGKTVVTVHDPKIAAEYCATWNERHEKDEAFLDSLKRAAGRP